MMQTEFRMRLLRYDKGTPSGYKIVGYAFVGFPLRTPNMGNLKSIRYSLNANCRNECSEIKFHAIDVGINICDEWWYDGDRVSVGESYAGDSLKPSFVGVLSYLEDSWVIEHMDDDYFVDLWDATVNYGAKVIGNRHETRE